MILFFIFVGYFSKGIGVLGEFREEVLGRERVLDLWVVCKLNEFFFYILVVCFMYF